MYGEMASASEAAPVGSEFLTYHAVSHTLPLANLVEAAMHGWLRLIACVRPSTALEHATRSVRVWQPTMCPSFARARASFVAGSRRGGQVACFAGSNSATHCAFMQTRPLPKVSMAGTQGSPQRSKLAQQCSWFRMVMHCASSEVLKIGQGQRVGLTVFARVRDASRRRSIDESTGRRVVCMRAPTAQGRTSVVRTPLGSVEPGTSWTVVALWLHSSPSQ